MESDEQQMAFNLHNKNALVTKNCLNEEKRSCKELKWLMRALKHLKSAYLYT